MFHLETNRLTWTFLALQRTILGKNTHLRINLVCLEDSCSIRRSKHGDKQPWTHQGQRGEDPPLTVEEEWRFTGLNDVCLVFRVGWCFLHRHCYRYIIEIILSIYTCWSSMFMLDFQLGFPWIINQSLPAIQFRLEGCPVSFLLHLSTGKVNLSNPLPWLVRTVQVLYPTLFAASIPSQWPQNPSPTGLRWIYTLQRHRLREEKKMLHNSEAAK